ncbi:MAG: hypothetical protein KAS32_01390 [Candidatus Peribacteraceae bacterium]|nr:hypothetical protein [Candidatus Peribacteraceae bacterium]
MVVYGGIPKKRRLYVDDQGRQIPLDRRSGASHYQMVASSGTLSASGDMTVTGTQFKPDSVVTASYNTGSAGTAPIDVVLGDGTVEFNGDNDAKFYYIAFNLTV